LVKFISTLEEGRKMKIRKIKVVINGQSFTPKELRAHDKEMERLSNFDIEECEKIQLIQV